MKLKNVFLMAVLTLGMAACSNDEPENGGSPTDGKTAAELIVGSYEGVLNQSVMNTPMGKQEMTLKVEAEEGGTVKLTFPFGEEFAEGVAERAMGFSAPVVISHIKVKEENGTYSLKLDDFSVMSGETNVTGSLTGTITEGKADITCSMKPGAMPMEVVCNFKSATTPAEKAAGAYTGNYTLSVMDSDAGSGSFDVTVEAEENGTIKITYPFAAEETVTSRAMGFSAPLVISGVAIEEKNGMYELKLDSYSAMSGATNVIGKISGTITKNGTIKLSCEAKPGAMPFPIIITFSNEEAE